MTVEVSLEFAVHQQRLLDWMRDHPRDEVEALVKYVNDLPSLSYGAKFVSGVTLVRPEPLALGAYEPQMLPELSCGIRP